MVYVEARIDVEYLKEDRVEHFAGAGIGVGRILEMCLWRKSERVIEVCIVTTRSTAVVDEGGESVVEGEIILVRIHKRQGCYFLSNVVRDTGVIDHETGQVEVLLVVLVQHRSSNIRAIHAGVRLSGDVDFAAMQSEEVDKVLPERQELSGHLLLARNVRLALGEASADGLLDEDHVGQIVPGIGVWDRRVGAGLPDSGSILVKESVQTTAPRAAI